MQFQSIILRLSSSTIQDGICPGLAAYYSLPNASKTGDTHAGGVLHQPEETSRITAYRVMNMPCG